MIFYADAVELCIKTVERYSKIFRWLIFKRAGDAESIRFLLDKGRAIVPGENTIRKVNTRRRKIVYSVSKPAPGPELIFTKDSLRVHRAEQHTYGVIGVSITE